MVIKFQRIFATYFYRGEFTGLRYRHFVDPVDNDKRWDSMGDKLGQDEFGSVRAWNELTMVDNGCALWTWHGGKWIYV